MPSACTATAMASVISTGAIRTLPPVRTAPPPSSGWNLRSLYPVGFSPQYGNVQNDLQLVGGLRGEITPKLRWDVSASYGRNAIDYSLKNSINASLGPASPTAFDLGRLTQTEKNANADFNYEWDVAALSQPVNVAFGGEFRQETYQVRAGDPASYAVGPARLQAWRPIPMARPASRPARPGSGASAARPPTWTWKFRWASAGASVQPTATRTSPASAARWTASSRRASRSPRT